MRIDGKDHPVLVIDTPGTGDSEGRDAKHTAEMVLVLKAVKRVNAFILCLNSSQPRFDENKQGQLKLLAQMFGDSFYQHVMICYTHWTFDRHTVKLRQFGRMLTKEKQIEDTIENFRAKLGIQLSDQ